MQISPQQFPWMSGPAAARIFAAFGEGEIRFVGGCVRNALWDKPVGDIDLATSCTPDIVAQKLAAAEIKSVPTGIDHGTITAVIDGKPYEITTLRKDVETDGRHAIVAFSTDWAEDAQRRDLTVNALYMDASGQIFDPTGEGLDDIAARKFRFVGDPAARVQEDYLRILRFFRFIAWYSGQDKVDGPSLRACREHARGLKSLSVQRVWSELKKMLSAPDPVRAFRIMLTNDILDVVLPEASNVDGLEHIVRLERREAIKPDPLLRLMAMSVREPLQMALLSARFKMSKAETARLRGWAEDDAQLSVDMPERERLAAIYRSGKQVTLDRARLRAAGTEDAILSSKWMVMADLAMGWTPPTFPLTGKDLQKAGVAPGPAMGKKLQALEKLWVRSGFTAEKPALLAALKMLGG